MGAGGAGVDVCAKVDVVEKLTSLSVGREFDPLVRGGVLLFLT